MPFGGPSMLQPNPGFTAHVSRGDERNDLKAQMSPRTAPAVDRWVDDQLFEEDVRAVLLMMRPNRRERLMGWSEYRAGGKDFRATISWNDEAIAGPNELPATTDAVDASEATVSGLFTVPNVVDVLEAILIGSIRADSELSPEQECEAYRRVLKAVERRVGQFQECYA